MKQLILSIADVGKEIEGESDMWQETVRQVKGQITVDSQGHYFAPDPLDSNKGLWRIAYSDGVITNGFSITFFDGKPWPYPPKTFIRLGRFKDGSRNY